jgi:hypothetical protein
MNIISNITMKNTAGVCHSGWGREAPKERQPATYFNKKGDRSLPKINYYVAYEKIQTVN